ncbi:MAG: dienelactone hydrolase family protein [Deltaproteobacteria bacterium]|nr:dienelactone hydrolase family protein [Deltaproteobacteria bacterium]
MIRGALLGLVVTACSSSPELGGGDASPDHDAANAPVDAPACGLRGGLRGKTVRTIEAGGLTRTYHVYLPAGDPETPMPLVFVHHGYTMSGQLMFDITGHADLADDEKFALVFPDGQGGPDSNGAPWNVGTGVCSSFFGAPPNASGDDFAMLDAITADLAEDQCLDREHVYVTGFSMGGYFAHHAGCMRPDIRGVAPHSGGTHDLTSCPSGKKPIIMFHGRADALIPASCSDPAAATAWAQHNGCATTTTSRTVTGGTCVRYDGCPAGGQVELCTFSGMAHCWAGGALSAGIYSCPAYESATRLAWQFWKTDAW